MRGNVLKMALVAAEGADYRGDATKTASGKACVPWSADFVRQYPHGGLGAHAFCRNPDGDHVPWCLTSPTTHEYGYCALARCAPNAARAEGPAAAATGAPRGALSAAAALCALAGAAALLVVATMPLARAASRGRRTHEDAVRGAAAREQASTGTRML
jgi:hypothetical protein